MTNKRRSYSHYISVFFLTFAVLGCTNGSLNSSLYGSGNPAFQENIVRDSSLVVLLDAAAPNGLTPQTSGCQTMGWTDISGHSNNASLMGFSGTTCNNYGWKGSGATADPYRLSLDGTTTFVQLSSLPNLTSFFTVEMWINNSSSALTNIPFAFGSSTNLGGIYVSLNSSSGSITQTTSTTATSSGSPPSKLDNGWHYVAAIYGTNPASATGALFLVVDGNMYGGASSGGAFSFSGAARLAADINGTPSFTGSIGKLAVYNRQLDFSELNRNCTASQSRFGGTATCPPAKPKRAFTTSNQFMGSGVGSVPNATSICTSQATTAGLGGTWMAYLADSGHSPSATLPTSQPPYVAVDNKTMIMPGGPYGSSTAVPPAISEAGNFVGGNIWLDTNGMGALSGSNTCLNWTDGSSANLGGIYNGSSAGTMMFGASQACNIAARIFCLEL